jgi:hypothetical protein
LLRKWAIWSTVILDNGIKKGIPVWSLYRTLPRYRVHSYGFDLLSFNNYSSLSISSII